MSEKTLVPKLRFSGFDENWKEVKLSDIIEKIIDFRGKTPKKIGLNWGGTIPALSAINVKMGKIEFNDETHYGNEKLYNKWMTNGDCEKNDIVMTMEAPMGNIAQIPDNNKYILSQRVILLKLLNNVNNDFIYSYMKSFRFQNQLNKYATGSTAKGIKQKNLIKTNVSLPNLEEQTKIAEFLKNIELKIELLEKKHDYYQDFKKYLMQQIFAQKLRFNEFEDEWKKAKLKDICKVQDGSHFTPNYVDDGVPFYSVENITNNVPPKFITREEHEKLIKRCKPQFGDILITRIGTLAKSKFIDWNEEFSIYVSLALLSSIKINARFLNYYIQSERYKKDFLSKSLLIAVPPKINLNDLNNTIIEYPSFNEQEKIACLFDSVDSKIYNVNTELFNLKNFKNGLLQQMFV